MTYKHCLIVASGSIHDYALIKSQLKEVDYIVSADGGANHLKELELAADIFLGDFDSIDAGLFKEIEASQRDIIKYPTRKDVTDSEIAVEYCLELRPEEITIIGVTGQRLDHTVANMMLLKRIKESSIKGSIIDDNNTIRYIDDVVTVNGAIGDIVSIIPLSGEMIGVCTEGLDYPLLDETLNLGSTRSISNIMKENQCKITIKEGFGLVIKSRD